MWLQKGAKPEMVHGVDYHKGLEDGRDCYRKHPYNTVHCRPVLFTDEWVNQYSKDEYVDYDSLTEREKLELGEPVFFGSSFHRLLNGPPKYKTFSDTFNIYEGAEVEDNASSNQ